MGHTAITTLVKGFHKSNYDHGFKIFTFYNINPKIAFI